MSACYFHSVQYMSWLGQSISSCARLNMLRGIMSVRDIHVTLQNSWRQQHLIASCQPTAKCSAHAKEPRATLAFPKNLLRADAITRLHRL